MKKIIPALLLAFFLVLPARESPAFFGSFNPCDDCKFFLRYCCPGKCPVLDFENVVWQALVRLRHRDRLEIVGKWREARNATLRTLGHEGERVSTGTPIQQTRAVPRFPGHDTLTYGIPQADIWLSSIPPEESARRIVCARGRNIGRDRALSHLRTSTIADASAALPNLAVALAHGEQRAAAAIRGAEQAADSRDMILRIADFANARNQIHSVTTASHAIQLQMLAAGSTDRKIYGTDETSIYCREE